MQKAAHIGLDVSIIERKLTDNEPLTPKERESVLNHLQQDMISLYSNKEFVEKILQLLAEKDNREPAAKVSDIHRLEKQIEGLALYLQCIMAVGGTIIFCEVLLWLAEAM